VLHGNDSKRCPIKRHTARLSVSVLLAQAPISGMVRKQPMHKAVLLSIWQTEIQGEGGECAADAASDTRAANSLR